MFTSLSSIWKKNFVKNFFVYSSGAIFLKGVSFLLIPVYTKILSPKEYGQLELINTVVSVLSILFGMGISQLVYIRYIKINESERKEFVQNIIKIYILISSPLLLLSLLVFLNFNIFSLPGNYHIPVLLGILTAYFTFFQTVYFTILQLEQKAILQTYLKIFTGILILLLNIYLVIKLRWGISGILFSNFFLLFITFIYVLINQNILISFNIFRSVFKGNALVKTIRMGFPFIVSSLSSWLMIAVDRWIVVYFLNQTSVGLYSVAFKFAMVFEPLLIAPVLSVYSPFIFEKFNNKEYNQNSLKIVIGTLVMFSILGIGVTIIAKLLIDKAFTDSLILIPFIVIGFAFSMLSQIFAALMLYLQQSRLLVLNVFIAGLCNVGLNLIFINYLGLMGVAIAFLLSNLCWFLLTFLQNYRIKKSLINGD